MPKYRMNQVEGCGRNEILPNNEFDYTYILILKSMYVNSPNGGSLSGAIWFIFLYGIVLHGVICNLSFLFFVGL